MVKALWQYRYFILAAIIGDIKKRFARSKLGSLWCILNPLAQSMIFALVLVKFLHASMPGVPSRVAYPIYLMAGNAAWGLFTEITNRCLGIFIEFAATLKKISFPRLCLPIVVWGNAMVNHLLLLCAMAIIFTLLGQTPGLAWLALFLGILFISVFAFGLGLLLGIFNVFWRDIGQVMGIVFQLWFWMTPIVYVKASVPEHFQWIMTLNPMAALVNIYQEALLFNRWPDLYQLIPYVLMATVLFFAAYFLFRRASAELVDEL